VAIRSIADKATQDLYDGRTTKDSRKLPKGIWRIAQRKLDMLNAASQLPDLRVPPGNRLEALRGALRGLYSIRINDQWRVVFRWDDGHAHDVRIVDYHRG
jgi:toxin HigB-1